MRFFTILILLLCNQIFFAQSNTDFWKPKNEASIQLNEKAKRQIIPQKYDLMELHLASLKAHLEQAPMEAVANSSVLLDIPLPNGDFETFEVWESPIMEAGLAAKFPHIKTFKVRSTKNLSHIGRIGYTDNGFHATFDTETGQVYIDPYATEQTQYYIVYYTKNHVNEARYKSMQCEISHEDELEYLAHIEPQMEAHHAHHVHELTRSSAPIQRREYRLALATTAEYSIYHGGTVSSVMSAVVTCMNRVNGVIETELGIHLNLIDNNDQLFFFDGTTDGYTNGNTGQMINQNPTVINNIISPNDYDMGHVFGTNAGGLAQLASVCTDGKARGVTCHGNPIGDNFYVDYVCHEMGHQFGGPHTFNLCDNDNENAATAFEPGSGSTIMSYSGLCGANNLQFDSDDYYNIGALELMTFYMQEGFGNSCAEHFNTSNNTPVAEIPFEGNFFIPIGTPFELEGAGTDEDGDQIRYCWEQYDRGPSSPVGSPTGNAPIIRSWPPTTNTIRTIPRTSNLINNSFAFGENLPGYSRDMTFRLTVRDYATEAGGTDWAEVKFKATDTAGPFRVQYPSAVNLEMEVGDFVEIRWDVANTDNGPVNCQNVNIYLSTNGGNAFPIVLAENTPNDGKEFVVIPDNVTTQARIKVKSADNIFFDISNSNFSINAPSTPGYSLATSPNAQQVCLPNEASVSLETTALLGYDSLINFEIIDGLPDGAVASFSSNPATPTDGSVIDIDMSAVTEEGLYEVQLLATAPNVDTAYRSFFLEVVSNDFSALSIASPTQGESGVSTLPSLSWNGVEDANHYRIEIATSPAFGNTIIDSADNLMGTSYTTSLTLESSSPYYWRVFPVNECGEGMPLLTSSFHTVTFNCAEEGSVDTPLNISGSGAPTVESRINVLANGTINDINIPVLKGNHEWFSDIRATLTSPAGTEVLLFTNKCLNYNGNFNFRLDDEAPVSFQCPPSAGNFRPQQALAAFIGENTAGNWTLRIQDQNGGSGGKIDEWRLEFCASVSATPPVLVTNIEMPVNPNDGRDLSNDFLLTEDPNNEEWELIYTIVDAPQKGTLALEGTAIGVGDEFTQSDIHWGRLRYTHSGANALDNDFFRFTVRDDEGGWVGTPQFDILIDPDAVVGTKEIIEDNRITVFPNPSSDWVQVGFQDATQTTNNIRLIDVKGQVITPTIHLLADDKVELNVSNLASGVYFIKVQMDDTVGYKKLIVE